MSDHEHHANPLTEPTTRTHLRAGARFARLIDEQQDRLVRCGYWSRRNTGYPVMRWVGFQSRNFQRRWHELERQIRQAQALVPECDICEQRHIGVICW